MAWVRAGEFCPDVRTLDGMFLDGYDPSPQFVNTPTFRTGRYVARWKNTTAAFAKKRVGIAFPLVNGQVVDYPSVRFGCHIYVTSLVGTQRTMLFAFDTAASGLYEGISVTPDLSPNTWVTTFDPDGSVYGEIAEVGDFNAFLGGFNRWAYLSVVHTYQNGLQVYVDGVQKFHRLWQGNSHVVMFGGAWETTLGQIVIGNVGWETMYLANLIVDVSTEQNEAPIPVNTGTELWRLNYATDETPGGETPWNVVGAATPLECIDDATHDGDTTYIWADSPGNKFHGATDETFVLPDGYQVEAVIPYGVGAILGTPDGELRLVVSQETSPGVWNESESEPAQNVYSAYRYFSARFTTDVLGDPFDQDSVNDVRTGFETL